MGELFFSRAHKHNVRVLTRKPAEEVGKRWNGVCVLAKRKLVQFCFLGGMFRKNCLMSNGFVAITKQSNSLRSLGRGESLFCGFIQQC